MQLKLKKTLKLKKSHKNYDIFPAVEKGRVVEYDEKTRKVKHPFKYGHFVLDEGSAEKYFDQIFRMETDLSLAGKTETLTAKEWKRIYGYEIGLVAGAKFIPIL